MPLLYGPVLVYHCTCGEKIFFCKSLSKCVGSSLPDLSFAAAAVVERSGSSQPSLLRHSRQETNQEEFSVPARPLLRGCSDSILTPPHLPLNTPPQPDSRHNFYLKSLFSLLGQFPPTSPLLQISALQNQAWVELRKNYRGLCNT